MSTSGQAGGATIPPTHGGTEWSCAAAIACTALTGLRSGIEPLDGSLHMDKLLYLALWEGWEPASAAAAVAAAAALNKWSPGSIPRPAPDKYDPWSIFRSPMKPTTVVAA